MSTVARLLAWLLLLASVVWLSCRPRADADAARVPVKSALPWSAVGDSSAPTPAAASRAILYVSAACPHCEGVARYVDSLARTAGVPLVIMSPDADSLMALWRRRTGVQAPIRRDARRAMRRALLVQYVPTLVAWDADGRGWRAVGADRRAMGRVLEAAR